LKKNIIANFFGRFWSVLSNFIFVPLYINLLGLESYSLISFTLVLNGIMAMMDAGLTATLSREFASSNNSVYEKLRIYKTLETCYFIIAALVIVLLLFSSELIAFRWLNLEKITSDEVSFYLHIISIEIGFRLLSNFYSGGFIGLEKQIKSNMYQVAYGVVRNGFVLMPIFFYPSLRVFFIWQATTTILYVVFIRFDLSYTLTQSFSLFFKKPRIEKEVIYRIWKFAGGMMLISTVAGLNTQMDKLALSKLLPIEVLGIYTLAFALAKGLGILSSPVSVAILPRMTALFTAGNKLKAVEIFNKGYLLVSIVIFSFAASMIFFAKELIWVWTNDVHLAEKASVFVPWIAMGTAFLSLGNLPYNVAIANGYTKYNNILGISSLVITLPGYWLLTNIYGGIGAAITFSFVQVIVVIIFLHIVNKKFMQLSIKIIFFRNFILPILISGFVTFMINNAIIFEGNRLTVLLKIGFTVACTLATNILILYPTKSLLKQFLKIKNKFT